MSKIVNFPSKIPTPQQFELPRVQLIDLLQTIATEAMGQISELMKADNAAEFAAVVHKTAEKIAGHSAGWSEMSKTIRESWHL